MNLNQVTISSSNLNQAIEFYELLGLKLIVRSDDEYARFVCSESNATFSILKAEVVDPSNGTVVYFECHDLDEKVRNLEERGVVFLEKPTDKPWLWREAHLQDPDGNMICLYFAGENRLNPPWRIN